MHLLYSLHELRKATISPLHAWLETVDMWMENVKEVPVRPYYPLMKASATLLERTTRVFQKPEFGVSEVNRNGILIQVREEDVLRKPFCRLKHFRRLLDETPFSSSDPKVLIVAPLSGHFSTLLRDTVRSMIPHHNVYITDWVNASEVPMEEGNFTLDHYIDYLLDFMRYLGDSFHIIAVCQPSVPVLCAVSLLAEYNEPCQPKTMTLMGGPIDTRINPGKVNEFALTHSIDWFKDTLITCVPPHLKGAGRRVCPGFLMLSGFMSLNMDRHQQATLNFFNHLIQGDQESAENHKRFYDEYRSVLDMPEDYFLDSIQSAFQDHSLPKGTFQWKGYPITPAAIEKTVLLTIEGQLDDISQPGQTVAAHDLCHNIPSSLKFHHLQEGVGHYGLFNGRRWRTFIQPKIAQMILKFNG